MNISVEVNGLKELEKSLKLSRFFELINTGYANDFQNYLMNKCRETLERVIKERLIPDEDFSQTANDIQIYKSSNHIIRTNDGFTIYNNATIDAQGSSKWRYPSCKFSLALAFEYGTGIIGCQSGYNSKYFESWDWNVNQYENGWFFPSDEPKDEHSFKTHKDELVKIFNKEQGIIGSTIEGQFSRDLIDATGKKYDYTQGYAGFEIYRYLTESVKRNLPRWVKEYINRRVV